MSGISNTFFTSQISYMDENMFYDMKAIHRGNNVVSYGSLHNICNMI